MSRRCGAPAEEPRLVVVTGGEPMLQLDDALVDGASRSRISEWRSRPTARLPDAALDWICVSPKAGTDVVQQSGNELKLVWPQAGIDPGLLETWAVRAFPRPADGLPGRRQAARRRDRAGDGAAAWRLTLQAHKVVGLA